MCSPGNLPRGCLPQGFQQQGLAVVGLWPGRAQGAGFEHPLGSYMETLYGADEASASSVSCSWGFLRSPPSPLPLLSSIAPLDLALGGGREIGPPAPQLHPLDTLVALLPLHAKPTALEGFLRALQSGDESDRPDGTCLLGFVFRSVCTRVHVCVCTCVMSAKAFFGPFYLSAACMWLPLCPVIQASCCDSSVPVCVCVWQSSWDTIHMCVSLLVPVWVSVGDTNQDTTRKQIVRGGGHSPGDCTLITSHDRSMTRRQGRGG